MWIFVFWDMNQNIFKVWTVDQTKQGIWICQFGLWEIVIALLFSDILWDQTDYKKLNYKN